MGNSLRYALFPVVVLMVGLISPGVLKGRYGDANDAQSERQVVRPKEGAMTLCS